MQISWNTALCMGKSLCSMHGSHCHVYTLFGQAGIPLILLSVTLGTKLVLHKLSTGFSIVWAFRPRESPLLRDKPRKKSFLLFTFSSYYIMAMKARNPVGITTHHRQSVTCTSTCPGASLITKLSAHFLLIAEINELVKHHENFVLSNSFHSPCPLLWTIVMRERERREMCAGTAGWVSLYKTAARHTFSLTILKQHYFSLQ